VDHPRATWQLPALWVITAWGAARLSGPYAEVVGAAGLVLVALYMAQRTYHEYWAAAVCALWMDGGLAYRGALDSVAFAFHVAFVIGVCMALRRAPALREARAAQRRARAQESRDAEVRNAAREFGLLTRQAPRISALPSLKEGRPTVGRATLDFLSDSFRLQTKILRSTMGLNTAAVLWITPDSMTLRGMDTIREDVLQGPYQRGEGAPGSLLGKPYIQEMSLYPVTAHHRIPYYESTAGVGAALMVPIPAAASLQTSRPGEPVGVLCLDRAEDRPFTLEERAIAKAAARKLALDVATGQRLKATDHERSTVRRFCAALQSLNGVLGLDQVGQATLEATRDLVAADLAVLSLVKDDVQRVVRAVGTGSEQFSGLQFSIQDGLAGQAIRVRYPLPSGGEYNGNSYVFTRGEDLSTMRSLLVVPLLMPEGEPIGSITVAARAEGAFRGANREMLDLIAGQVAIKLDLAHAHDQISELATTDGITGLKNHRTFQQAFDTMLSRASRGGAPLSVVMCDIDHFKSLNDSCGHPFGDDVLRDVACVLRNAVRQVDLAARYGGEEFALLLEDSSESGARLTADRIRREVEALEFTHPRNGSPVTVTISLGIAVFSSESVAKAELIQRADDAMYYAKENGRNQVRSWSELPMERPGGPPNPPAALATMAR
jgi:diguanylate cyclase (GGDEF)-like protein